MAEDQTYKKLYIDLKKQFDRFVKHRRHHTKRCNDCRRWYNEVLQETNKIKDKKLRDNLLEVWGTLWINNSLDFDIIATLFEVDKK